MSRFEFHPVTREPFRQEPPEQSQVPQKLEGATSDEQAPKRQPSRQVDTKREGIDRT